MTHPASWEHVRRVLVDHLAAFVSTQYAGRGGAGRSPREARLATAYHEAAHATLAVLLGIPIARAWIGPHGGGATDFGGAWADERQLRNQIAATLAGHIAECHFSGGINGVSRGDLSSVVDDAWMLVTQFQRPWLERHGFVNTDDGRVTGESAVFIARVCALVDRENKRAATLILQHAETINAVAAQLCARDERTGEDVRALVTQYEQHAARAN